MVLENIINSNSYPAIKMDNHRSYTPVNPQNPKRRHESRSHHEPPPKKPRHNDNGFQRSYTSTGPELVLPDPPPKLPPITEEYAKMVFTHPGSTMKGTNTMDMANYDRLEYLGDAYIEIIASRLIFENYPTTNAGGMCQLREAVVKNETLSKYSVMYGFDKKLNVRDFDFAKSGKLGWTKIYGDVFEAYAAAVVLSDPKDGQARLESWLQQLWAPVLKEVKVRLFDDKVKAKEELTKKIVVPGVKLNYVQERKPIAHVGKGKETFFIGVYMDGWGWKNQHLGSGEGASKTIAGNEAALNAMENHPLIDEVIAKKTAYMAERAAKAEAEEQKG